MSKDALDKIDLMLTKGGLSRMEDDMLRDIAAAVRVLQSQLAATEVQRDAAVAACQCSEAFFWWQHGEKSRTDRDAILRQHGWGGLQIEWEFISDLRRAAIEKATGSSERSET